MPQFRSVMHVWGLSARLENSRCYIKMKSAMAIHDNILKKTVTFCFCIFLSSLCVLADSTFVDAGIVYKLISVDSVNIMALKEGHADVVLWDSVLNVPANVRHDGRLYHVRCIGKEAFAGNCGIKHVAIGKGIEEIQEHAFAACANMESISIPASVTVIGDGMFKYCVSLDSVCIDDGNKTYDSRGGCNAIILSESNRLLFGCKGTRIPASVECIGKDAFYGCMIDSIVIPEGVTRIHDYAFVYCQNLTRIHISSTVDWIDECAFSFCSNITTITVDEGNETYDSRDGCNAILCDEYLVRGCNTTVIPSGVKVIERMAFSQCANLRSIDIPEGVTTIRAGAFADCLSLRHVSLPSTLACLDACGGGQFYGCTSLDSIYIPGNVKEIGTGAFGGCSSLRSIIVDPRNKTFDSRGNCNAIIQTSEERLMSGCNSTIIPDGVMFIHEDAFSGSGITAVDFPASVMEIDSMAFRGCDRCMSITVAADNPYYKSDGSNSVVERKTGRLVLGCATTRFLPGVTGIGAYAFASTPEVLVLPDGIRDIGICAFANCRNLSAIIVPSSVKHIGRGAFSGCRRLPHKVIMCNDVMDEPAY